ncbi:DUF3606 domain-containing protein [Mesorhizobium sp. WSM3224]|uniref:DUF3606 domain-containing protein n=1 Tax=Mesorhizobium sp. WSM3224 TaxID=1040986 RepID=UPI00040586F4|nr:DUF3606 domain-containing protein [Mesorhizobium sp. WSM3224]
MTKSAGKNRGTLAVVEDHEIEHFARQNGVTTEQVKRLIAQHGSDRVTLTQATKALKQTGDQDASGADKVTRQAHRQATPMHIGKTTGPG